MTAKLKLLTRDEILATDDRTRELVEVPEWGGSVWVRSLSGLERDRYEGAMVAYRRLAKGGLEIDRVVTDNIRARLVSLSVVDEAGNRLFTDVDVIALGSHSAQALNRICEVAQRLSGLSTQDVEALKGAIERDPTDASPSALPVTLA
jgi:hypothetical protein